MEEMFHRIHKSIRPLGQNKFLSFFVIACDFVKIIARYPLSHCIPGNCGL